LGERGFAEVWIPLQSLTLPLSRRERERQGFFYYKLLGLNLALSS
jgi:hypothetical protein